MQISYIVSDCMYVRMYKDQPIMLLFLSIMLCCSAHKTYYAQYYAHVKGLCFTLL